MSEEQNESNNLIDDQEEILIDHYELMYIIPVSFTTDEVKPIAEKVVKKIKNQEGEVTKQEDLGKLKFGYIIKHNNHGYYQLVEFDMPKSNVKELNESLKLTNGILRYLLTKKKIKTEKEIADEKNLQNKLAKKKEKEIEDMKAAKEEAKDKPKKETIKEKVSLDELDKKLDEILDTDEII